MIDTSKYEGHAYSVPSWKWAGNRLHSWVSPEPLVMRLENEWEGDEATMQLIADAPLLLDEVKRLRKQLSKAMNWVRDYFTDINGDYTSYENRAVHGDFVQQMEMKE